MGERRAVLILLLILCSVLVTFPNIGMVKANETIYIRADGNVEGTNKIQRKGNVYTLTGNINGSIVVESDNITIDGNGYTLQAGTGTGIYLFGRENVAVRNTQIKTFGYGIVLNSSSNNHINGNNIIENHGDGIYLYASSNNSINGNNIMANKYGGIRLSSSSNNSISGNNLTNNEFCINLHSYSNYNTISGNNITNSLKGISLYYSSNNIIYHNNLMNNTYHVYSYASTNVWDADYPSGGNYWSNHNDADLYSGIYQNETGSDGIGDTPYVINENNQDSFPLVNVIPEFPSWIILSLLLVTMLFAIIIRAKIFGDSSLK